MIARGVSLSALSVSLLAWAALAGCNSSSSPGGQGGAGGSAPSGPVAGPLDDHCAAVAPIVVNAASCHPATTVSDADAAPEEEAPVLYNAVGDDDDCKYHVEFTTTPASLRVNQTVAFNVYATYLAPSLAATPLTGANIQIESYLSDNPFHVIPNTNPVATESPATSGNYKITPIKFDVSGRWVVRFHLYEDCSDLSDDSPHGHIAFYVDVP